MLYICLKIIHILSASLLLVSMAYSCHLWKQAESPQQAGLSFQPIQTQTWLLIVPLAMIQLASGFTMINIQRFDLTQLWISGSVIGFIAVIGSWFTFIYLLLLAQQAEASATSRWNTFRHYRRLQAIMLVICGVALLIMIFLMANKT